MPRAASHRYFEHATPGSAQKAWKEQCGIKMDLDMDGAGIIETTWGETTWGEKMKPVALLTGTPALTLTLTLFLLLTLTPALALTR